MTDIEAWAFVAGFLLAPLVVFAIAFLWSCLIVGLLRWRARRAVHDGPEETT